MVVCRKEIVFGQFGCIWAKVVVFWQGVCNWEKLVVFVQSSCFRKNGCIMARWLYSGKIF